MVLFSVGCSKTDMAAGTSIEANLSSLTASVGTLTPSYHPNIATYTLNLRHRVSDVSFTLQTTKYSTFKVNGQPLDNPYSFSTGSENVEIEVTSATGSQKKTYVVTVVRARQFVYVSNVDTSSTPDNLSLFSINPNNGQLEPLSTPTVAVGDDPYDLLVSPDGDNLYVGNSMSDTVSQFSLNPFTGIPSALTPPTVAQGPAPYAMAMTPDSRFLYCPNGDSSGPGVISQYSVGVLGNLTPLSPAAANSSDRPWFLAVHPNGRYLYATIYNPAVGNDTVEMYFIDPITGTLSLLTPSTVATEDKPWHINIDPSGSHAYLTNEGSASVSGYSINPTTGILTPLSGSPYAVENNPIGLTIDPQGRFVYVANSGSDSVSMFTRNPSTGELTPIGTGEVAAADAPYGLEVEHEGRYLYVASSDSNTIRQFAINQSTGALTPLMPATVTAGTNPRFIRISR